MVLSPTFFSSVCPNKEFFLIFFLKLGLNWDILCNFTPQNPKDAFCKGGEGCYI